MKLRLDDIEAKANKATCGPWHIDRRNDDDAEIIYVDHIKDYMGNPVGICRTYQIVGDGEYIASMNPQTALALVRIAKELQHAMVHDDLNYNVNAALREAMEVVDDNTKTKSD